MRSFLPLLLLLGLPLLADAQTVADTLVATPTALATALPDTLAPALALPAPDSAVAAAPDTTLTALQGLSDVERRQRGRADAKKHYRPARGVFWGGLGMGVASPVASISGGPLGFAGTLGGALGMGLAGPRPDKLQASAPQPELLRDPNYRQGYKLQASNKKLGKAILGWGIGATVAFAGLIVAVAVALSGGFS
ncbi:hypothetical protein LJ737_04735 [Hymenobacter sp. 15J16-1T3B]|uniref:hypothetical protein n=1 Tax=Hymenobacter sp. 15J16-1T3B TaxID=2886941 RepID=UPI001D1080E8|nr:hypothetical protein [Hymenobacter sp. 15J16-1T3B]MCC3156531.1 hypothetical protein [Hymenobacter sp. 15J16-1T3B]